ncbi:2-isopropylmalate synthase [Oxobacter pfennigii]|uniref:2-isopropylmalate synthase n=1 Tax=Oxobacter pfennigii TaxID=36849 RepID=A0A0P8Z0K6_9CLOT|nr:hypothetical protein [Oxobacter pfennigii]KPU45697.1 2-isopropylmalate synthase [Oxobacter pfennigii]
MPQNTEIIDRTVLEILKSSANINKEDLKNLSHMIEAVGAGFQELDKSAVGYFDIFPDKTDFLYKAEDINDVKIIRKYGFENVVINIKNIKEFMKSNYCRYFNGFTTLEVECNTLKDAVMILENNDYVDLASIDCIRMKGLYKQAPYLVKQHLEYIRENFRKRIHLSPVNTFNCAGAVCIEGIGSGVDYVTSSFCGKGMGGGWAALEELIMSSIVIYGKDIEADTEILPQAAHIFQKITGSFIHQQKPVLGCDIFKCESGIHVDGIYKNPALYEPYLPETVGKKREIVLGKHSGAAALIIKLQEMDMDIINSDKIRLVLDKIREKSITLKGDIRLLDVIKIIEEYNSAV